MTTKLRLESGVYLIDEEVEEYIEGILKVNQQQAEQISELEERIVKLYNVESDEQRVLKTNNDMLWKAILEIRQTYAIKCTGLKNGELVACQLHQEIANECTPTVAIKRPDIVKKAAQPQKESEE